MFVFRYEVSEITTGLQQHIGVILLGVIKWEFLYSFFAIGNPGPQLCEGTLQEQNILH
jgi:hypothetical protein